ncbi:polysaccharide deacetylase family protein [Acuticoccus mangrovi]|uniref:Polysaccharide deacetylase n=1 Tax=Acuticoccus mangrovi TaxID=2796142 RepID=A0A934IN57_9HYPH|nr:hypothetical protein [Acuticoccus mangrovi]
MTETARVYVVPIIDVNWLVFAPFDPGRDYRVDPPNVPQSVVDMRTLTPIMKDLTDGKMVLTPHSGTYCRDGYLEGEIVDTYREAIAGGAEMSVHLHEEIKGEGTRYAEWDHVKAMFEHAKGRMEEAGISCVAYRGGHYAYHPFMNRLLEANGIHADYSCCPGMNHPDREAIWTEAGTTAAHLPQDPRAPWAGQTRTTVLEIPIGSDGEGFAYKNILHVEMSELDNLLRVYDVVAGRAEAMGVPQIVHCLFHTASVGKPEWLARYRAFLEALPKRGAAFISTAEAHALHAEIAGAAA